MPLPPLTTMKKFLRKAGGEDIEVNLARNRLRWCGHVSRMTKVKALLFSELASGTRPAEPPLTEM